MADLNGQSILVAGAGVLGLTVAVTLARAGARVTVCDPATSDDSASGVAAGMLAPVFESALDPDGGAPLGLLRAARDLWPGFLARLEAPADALDRSGAALVVEAGEAARADAVARRLEALDAEFTRLSPSQIARLHPGLSSRLAAGLFTPEDWRLSPRPVLAALDRAFAEAGGGRVRAGLELGPEGARLAGETIRCDALVIAAGYAAARFAAVAPALAALSPIKGQILHFAGGPETGPSLRDFAGYVVPQPGGAVAGATMEPGRSDLSLDPAALADIRARAARLAPGLGDIPAQGRAGVRAATPDGLPLVGGAGPGLWLAVGARRNGWLLAPLLAEILADQLAGGEGGPWAAAMAPDRFGREP